MGCSNANHRSGGSGIPQKDCIMEQQAFKDTSIFQNVLEWTDGSHKWRAEWSAGVWKVSKLTGAVTVFFRSVRGAKTLTPRQVHAAAQA